MNENRILLSNADSFKKIGVEYLKTVKLNNSEIEFLAIPLGINYAFSAELYLKYILKQLQRKSKQHNLNHLFNLLTPEIKLNIKALTDRKIHYSKKPNLKKIYFDKGFTKNLEIHSNIFYEWRYMHENINKIDISFDYNFFLIFLDVLEGYIKTNYPLK